MLCAAGERGIVCIGIYGSCGQLGFVNNEVMGAWLAQIISNRLSAFPETSGGIPGEVAGRHDQAVGLCYNSHLFFDDMER